MIMELISSNYSITHNISHISSENYLIHSHPFYELYYFISGDVHFLYAGTEYVMTPDTLIIIAPNVFHGILPLTKSPYERYTLHFLDGVISPERRNLLIGNLPTEQSIQEHTNPIPYIIPNASQLGLRPLLNEFDALYDAPETMKSSMVSILLENVLARLLLHTGSIHTVDNRQPYHTGQKELDRILTYIHQNLTLKLTLDDLCNQLFTSRSRLYSLFHQQMGTTVMEYVTRRRISYAQQLMVNGLSAAQAGTAAGFSDYSAFYRAYMKETGHSPKSDKRDRPSNSNDLFLELNLSDNPNTVHAQHQEHHGSFWESNRIIHASTHDPGALRDQ